MMLQGSMARLLRTEQVMKHTNALAFVSFIVPVRAVVDVPSYQMTYPFTGIFLFTNQMCYENNFCSQANLSSTTS